MSKKASPPEGARTTTAAKRRGKPWKPTADLGVPTKERASKSHGWDEDNLAGGDGPRVVRSSERMPFTPQHIRNRYTEDEIATAIRLKRDPNFDRKLTAIDRALEENEFHALDWFVENYVMREVGRPSTMRYDDTPRGNGGDDGNMDREKRWRINQRVLSVVEEILPEAYKDFLATLTWMANPGSREGIPPTKLEVGQQISQMKGKDAATGAFVGYTRAVAQAISNARADAMIIMKRRREAREQVIRDGRKAEAGMHFKVPV